MRLTYATPTGLCITPEFSVVCGLLPVPSLVEIGGSFRIPDIMRESGATLVEVGTTNRTRLSDYERAISENTAAILKVHPSNYIIEGFTESVEIPKLVLSFYSS